MPVSAHPAVTHRLRAATAAIGLAFLLTGTTMASWFARVPAVKREFELGDGTMGAMLACVAVGSLLAMPLAGALIARVGGRGVFIAAEICLCLAICLPALAPSPALLAAALTCLGAAHGLLDVSMNSQASSLEQAIARPIMPMLHAVFSVGGFAGAAIGALLAHWHIPIVWHLGVIALVFLLLVLPASRFVPASGEPGGLPATGHGAKVLALPDRKLAALAVIAFCALMAEGAINDWSAIYLAETLDTGPGVAALGYAVFSITMIIGRLAGGPLAARIQPARLIGVGGLVAAAGVLLCVLAPGRGTALAGFAVIGLGLAAVFPLAISAAGQYSDRPAATSVAAVSTAGYSGFLAGPALIGLLASLFGLRVGLGVLIFLGLVIAWTCRRGNTHAVFQGNTEISSANKRQ